MADKYGDKTKTVLVRVSKNWYDNVQAVAVTEGTTISQVIRESVRKETKKVIKKD